MTLRKLYNILNIEEAHSTLIKKIATTSEKSNQTLLSMMIRKNKELQLAINAYAASHKTKQQKQKSSLRLKASTS